MARAASRAAASGTTPSADTEGSEGAGFAFAPYTVFSIPAGLANSVAIGDVNGDGLDDAVVANVDWFDEPDSRKVYIYLQQQDGTLAAPIKVRYTAGYVTSVGITLADLNGDNIKDIVLAYGDVGIALGNASGNFTFNLIPMPSSVFYLGALDINLDGKLDLVAQTWSTGAYLLYGNGKGAISKTVFMDTIASGYDDLRIGDVTGDGFPDMVLSSGQGPLEFYVYPHNGFNGFSPVQIHALPSTDAWRPGGNAIGDFNGDGLNDIALTVPQNSPAYVRVYQQNVDGTLAVEPTSLASYDIPESAIAVDLDNDGHMDLVTAHGGGNAVGYYMNTGSGLAVEERVPVTYASHYESDGLAAGDLNGDGCADVALADYNYGMVILYGTGCGRRPHRMSTPAPSKDRMQ